MTIYSSLRAGPSYWRPPIDEFFLEIDGTWYETMHRGASIAASVVPSPGTTRTNLHHFINPRHWKSMQDRMPLTLLPGSHILLTGLPLSDQPDASGRLPISRSS